MNYIDLRILAELHPELGSLVGALQDGTREWRGEFGMPSIEALTWQPSPNGHSIGGILLHMAGCEMYWLQVAVGGSPPDPNNPAWSYDKALDQDNGNWPVPPSESIEWYLDLLDQTRAHMIELITQHNEPEKTYLHHGSTVTYRWILAHLVEHDSYHGGQVVLLHEMYKKLAENSELNA